MEGLIVTLSFLAIILLGIVVIKDPEEDTDYKGRKKKYDHNRDLESYNIDGSLDLDGNPFTTNEISSLVAAAVSSHDCGSDSGGCDGGGCD